jgi:plastocyanin
MTWHWHICFEGRGAGAGGSLRSRFLMAIVLLCATLPVSAADLKGQVELTNSREAVVRRNKDYSGVVLSLAPADSTAAPAAPPKHVEMIQKDKTFTPHVVAIPVGGTVDFPNMDPFYHNAFSSFAGQPFDLALYPPGTSRSVQFKHAGIVRVFCQIHPTMSAIIAVLPTPWYTVTPATGAFSITGVPPGDYHLKVFHERALLENLQFIERIVTVPAGGLTLPLISISETGYIPTPHLDKHGKPYPPEPGYGGRLK